MNNDLVGTLSMHASWCSQARGTLQPNWFVFPLSNRVKPLDPTGYRHEDGVGKCQKSRKR